MCHSVQDLFGLVVREHDLATPVGEVEGRRQSFIALRAALVFSKV